MNERPYCTSGGCHRIVTVKMARLEMPDITRVCFVQMSALLLSQVVDVFAILGVD